MLNQVACIEESQWLLEDSIPENDVEWIDRAIRRIENGWIQGDLTDFHGNVCLLGACIPGGSFTRLGEILDPVILDLFPDRICYDGRKIVGFNDHPNTTKEDVLLVLKHARASLDGGIE